MNGDPLVDPDSSPPLIRSDQNTLLTLDDISFCQPIGLSLNRHMGTGDPIAGLLLQQNQ